MLNGHATPAELAQVANGYNSHAGSIAIPNGLSNGDGQHPNQGKSYLIAAAGLRIEVDDHRITVDFRNKRLAQTENPATVQVAHLSMLLAVDHDIIAFLDELYFTYVPEVVQQAIVEVPVWMFIIFCVLPVGLALVLFIGFLLIVSAPWIGLADYMFDHLLADLAPPNLVLEFGGELTGEQVVDLGEVGVMTAELPVFDIVLDDPSMDDDLD